MSDILLEMKNIQKFFPGVHALDNANIEVRYGEVHALVGENGAGKSTLMKVLNGIYKKDGGQIIYKGEEIELSSPLDAQKRGIGMIHQELNLMPHLTVAENIFIGKEPMAGGVFLDQKKANQAAKELLTSMHLDIEPTRRIKTLTVAKQQMVEIAKALNNNSELFVMDEPTSPLTDTEIEELFRFIRSLRAAGRGIIYISHRLEELWRISDRITVMRDGQYVGTVNTAEVNRQDIISMMVGRVIYEEPKQKSCVSADAPVVLEAKDLVAPNVKNVSFQLRQGEILGFAGLVGAGRTETMRALFGADPRVKGEIFVNGQKVEIHSPSDAVKHGIGYLSEDRKTFGVATGLSVRDNCVMADLPNYRKGPLMNDKMIDAVTTDYIQKISIKTPSLRQLVRNLSGGNQQKIVIAKWLIKRCNVLIFDEPTRGIDVGAKSEIYKLMNKLIEEGKSIIMISSEMPELLRMSDRIVVMSEGAITGELDICNATQTNIMTFATMNM
ncbi:MAG: sugar ABC transporter ATP-binding protein [Eubacteriales bacterium]|nr:sugar ABC transporter ATP-binding protein [Eubacteriales bacterium]